MAEAPAALECRLWRILDLPGKANHLVIAEVVGVHIDDAVIADGQVDVTRYRPWRDSATATTPPSVRFSR